MKSDPKARKGRHPVWGQADFAPAKSSTAGAGWSQNQLHVQKALMEYLLLGRIG
jgi:hypothetical protein